MAPEFEAEPFKFYWSKKTDEGKVIYISRYGNKKFVFDCGCDAKYHEDNFVDFITTYSRVSCSEKLLYNIQERVLAGKVGESLDDKIKYMVDKIKITLYTQYGVDIYKQSERSKHKINPFYLVMLKEKLS